MEFQPLNFFSNSSYGAGRTHVGLCPKFLDFYFSWGATIEAVHNPPPNLATLYCDSITLANVSSRLERIMRV